MVCSLDEGVERIVGLDIREVGSSRRVDGPVFGQHYYLRSLPSRGVVIWAECAIRVARYDVVVGQVGNGLVEVVAGAHVREALARAPGRGTGRRNAAGQGPRVQVRAGEPVDEAVGHG